MEPPSRGQILSDDEAMGLAMDLARRGRGKVSPNPMVGAVLLNSQGAWVAAGFHAAYGHPHAEADLLDHLADEGTLTNGRLFVTLEPCAHQGKTPSCAQRLARLPLSEVIYGLPDPNSLAQGGAEILRAAGVKATRYQGALQSDLEELVEVFLYNIHADRSFVALKAGTTLDGKIAIVSTGESQWITGEKSRLAGHALRAEYDATLIGWRTLAADNPSLNVRHPDFPEDQNKVIILSPHGEGLEALENSKILDTHSNHHVFWVTAPGGPRPKKPGLQHLTCPILATDEFDLLVLKKNLRAQGLHSVLVEGGAETLAGFLRQNCAQRLHLFVAPMILGGQGLGWTDSLDIHRLSEALRLKNSKWFQSGEDIGFTARVD